MIKKIIIKITGAYYKWNGYSAYFANKIFFKLADDFRKKNGNLSSKIWAYKRGFLSQTVFDLGIHQTNVNDYLPDFDYYKMHPLNPVFKKWIDDKLTLRYILEPFSGHFPDYYFHFFRNQVLTVFECPKEYSGSIDNVIDLLRIKKKLVLKQVSGALGMGFLKLEYDENTFYVNKQEMDEPELKKKLISLNDYLVTEFIDAHKSLKNIYPHTVNAVRVTVIRTDHGECEFIAAHISFGTQKTGVTDHIPHGGVMGKVNLDNGEFSDFIWKEKNRFEPVKIHPDTGAVLEGSVPHWNLIKKSIKRICAYLPQLRYMGFDLAVTYDGFKILEINSHPGLTMQIYYPLLKNEKSALFFKSRM